ncbi:methyltransferase domain-containing protein [Sphingomonas sp. BIUV-7]|uniref:Methyltransferase domain-containing protein n=1 Tax=Sphingomonas natans TaxID=3063330 RepID=A0ABT8Y5T7_9SPHN|nr:class I SAM-dependent methyltransferase [Sphingomonas sp. BIUV-7]MDO6413692.1 methyltransferase domain-containing protein [Sphingomonas sp. BIUV-7]
MIKWVLAADNDAIRTACGEKRDQHITSTSHEGCLIYGPYLEIPAGHMSARLTIAGAARGNATIEITSNDGQRTLARSNVDLDRSGDSLFIECDLDTPALRTEIRLFVTKDSIVSVSGLEIDVEIPEPASPALDRPVGQESRKTFADKVSNGFIGRYLGGRSVLEIGFRGYGDQIVLPIVPQAIGIDIDYQGYDGRVLPFANESVDSIYTSHCLEHIPDYRSAFADWYRVLKVGGYLVISVPHQYLFEKQRYLPSFSNTDHKRYYTPESLLAEVRESWPEQSYRVRHLIENDRGFDYTRFPDEPSPGCYEIELVIEKMRIPSWRLDDGSVRPYSAAEFHGHGPRPDRWSIDIDFASSEPCKVWGPYARLVPAAYEAIFFFESDFRGESLSGDITLDVAVNRNRTVTRTLSGKEGADLLREGVISVPFQVADDVSHVEFRTFTGEMPMDGNLTFKGVDVRFQRD